MRIYCIGIGGIGLSALARYYVHAGHTVYGSDISDSPLIHTLQNEGVHIAIGEDASRITADIDMVVHTIAISETNPEFVQAKSLGILCKTYPEALGDITREKTTIAICGTHGKTTTTAMTYNAFLACGIKPTVIVGSLLFGVGTNFIPGDSEYLIVEACEYKRSFLHLTPKHVIITNIDADHLDYYKDIEDIRSAFQEFVEHLPQDGYLVTHSNVNLLTTGKKMDADCVDRESIELSVLGEHNQSNAQLVIALGNALGLSEDKVRAGLLSFRGTWRRLEYKGMTEREVMVYDDYGHHPTEIQATLDALKKKYPTHKLYVFFQPHLFSRTKLFLDSFAEVLAAAHHVYCMPIYAAREALDETISSDMLVSAIRGRGGSAELLMSKDMMPGVIDLLDEKESIAVNIGAGDAYVELDKLSLQ